MLVGGDCTGREDTCQPSSVCDTNKICSELSFLRSFSVSLGVTQGVGGGGRGCGKGGGATWRMGWGREEETDRQKKKK